MLIILNGVEQVPIAVLHPCVEQWPANGLADFLALMSTERHAAVPITQISEIAFSKIDNLIPPISSEEVRDWADQVVARSRSKEQDVTPSEREMALAMAIRAVAAR